MLFFTPWKEVNLTPKCVHHVQIYTKTSKVRLLFVKCVSLFSNLFPFDAQNLIIWHHLTHMTTTTTMMIIKIYFNYFIKHTFHARIIAFCVCLACLKWTCACRKNSSYRKLVLYTCSFCIRKDGWLYMQAVYMYFSNWFKLNFGSILSHNWRRTKDEVNEF